MVERKGRVRAFHIATVNVDTLKPVLIGQVAQGARLMTDGALLYRKICRHFANHEVVDHYAGEFVRGDVTTNTVEGFFGVLKRGIRRVYQHVSCDHSGRYLNEFAFRYSNRASLNINDTQGARNVLVGIEGRKAPDVFGDDNPERTNDVAARDII